MFEGITEFVAVAETSGFSSAAKKLGVSTSFVSRQISALEKRLGVQLFARTTRKIRLTPAGEDFYLRCRNIIDELQDAQQQLTGDSQSIEGRLRISLAGHFAECYLAPIIVDFVKQHPKLFVDLDFNSRNINLVDEGFDFAIRYGHLSDSSLVARKLTERKLIAAASKHYLQKFGEPIHPNELKRHQCLVTNLEHWRFIEAGKEFQVKVSPAWKSNNNNAILAACKAGLGIAYIPETSYQDSFQTSELMPVLEPFWLPSIPSWIIYPSRRFLPTRARKLIEYLIANISNKAW